MKILWLKLMISFKERIQKAKSFGIDDIVLDVGIGFWKNIGA